MWMWGDARGNAFCEENSVSCPDAEKKKATVLGTDVVLLSWNQAYKELEKNVLIVWNKTVAGSISRLRSLDLNLSNNLTPSNNQNTCTLEFYGIFKLKMKKRTEIKDRTR